MTINEVWPNGMPSIGQTAQRSRKITDRDIGLFTEISGDRNPLHYDEQVAKATPFGGIVVQGGVTSAILNAVVAEDLPGPGTVLKVHLGSPVFASNAFRRPRMPCSPPENPEMTRPS